MLTGAGLTEAQIASIGATGNIIGGAAGGFASGAIAGGNLRSGFQGSMTGGLFAGANALTQYSNSLTQMAARSTVAGLSAEMKGGSFSEAFRSTFGIEALSWAALTMREVMIAQSNLDDHNSSGVSVGLRGDRFKLGGCRFPCISPGDPLGGVQGGEGRIFFWSYGRGSVGDNLVETFAGPHDLFNSFMYDGQGNLQTFYQQGFGRFVGNVASALNVLPATPFALASAAQPFIPHALAVSH